VKHFIILLNFWYIKMANARDVSGMMRRLTEALLDDQLSSIQNSWNNKTLQVATVCSGTDAPILALEMLLPILNTKGVNNITMEHVFSCESVPFKRDFIQSTSNPPLLFNNVTELPSGRGKCHDGVTRNVPNGFHLLIAGTECVDFSSLSTTPKGLHDKGRSGTTFMATLELTKLKQPPIVILENVQKCPAKEMVTAFEDVGYVGAYCGVNTANYLLPQSRTRMYFLFVHPEKVRQMPDMDWASVLMQIGSERNEQSLVWTDFLRDDDACISATVAKSLTKKRKRGGKPLSASKGTKWLAEVEAVEKIEHLTPYDEEGGRPYSAITTDCPELVALPDRAKLRLDVQYKRAVKAGIDPTTTPLPWNPAQQLRFTDSKPWLRKIAPCVTPKHEWIVSTRKAPLTGRECLDLQGIPICDQVARDFDDGQLRDLAGNAMSSTVVGAACLAALVSCEIVACDETET
jgi:site-specific DNA-cytosine methylase